MLDGRITLAAIELFLSSENGREELARRRQAVAADQAGSSREQRAIDLSLLTAAERYDKYLERVEMKRTSLLSMSTPCALAPEEAIKSIARDGINGRNRRMDGISVKISTQFYDGRPGSIRARMSSRSTK